MYKIYVSLKGKTPNNVSQVIAEEMGGCSFGLLFLGESNLAFFS